MPNEREIFNRIFLGRDGNIQSNELIREIMVLGLTTFYKYDEVLLREKGRGEPLKADEIASIQLSEHRFKELERKVAEGLRRHVDDVRPAPTFWYGVWQNIVAAFLYSLLVALVAFTLIFNNGDLWELFGIEIKAVPAGHSG